MQVYYHVPRHHCDFRKFILLEIKGKGADFNISTRLNWLCYKDYLTCFYKALPCLYQALPCLYQELPCFYQELRCLYKGLLCFYQELPCFLGGTALFL